MCKSSHFSIVLEIAKMVENTKYTNLNIVNFEWNMLRAECLTMQLND